MEVMLNVISREGRSFPISLQAAKMSLTLRDMLDCFLKGEVNNEVEAIPLQQIDSNTLHKVIRFCEHYKTEANPEEERSYEINEWDLTFFGNNFKAVFDIVKAADYLQIHRLFDVSCKFIANFLKGKSSQEISEAFGLNNDFSRYRNDKVFNAL